VVEVVDVDVDVDVDVEVDVVESEVEVLPVVVESVEDAVVLVSDAAVVELAESPLIVVVEPEPPMQ